MEVKIKTKRNITLTIEASDVLSMLVERFAPDKDAAAYFADEYGDTMYPTSVVITYSEDSE